MQHFLKKFVFILKQDKKDDQITRAMTVKLNANEVVLNAGDTNQVIDNNTIEGKLIVTNQRLYFKPLKDEAEKFNLEIMFDNILEVIFYSKGLFSVKGLNVVTRDGKCHTFPLKKRDEIGQLINKMY
jgi:hypothetical protein